MEEHIPCHKGAYTGRNGIGWNDQPERLRGYIRRMCKADDVRFLTPQQASIIIDGLTAMRDGDRAERKA